MIPNSKLPKELTLNQIKIPEEDKNSSVIRELNKTIKGQLQEIAKFQEQDINENNYKEIEQILMITSSLIADCHMSKQFNYSKNKNFNILIYEYQKLSVRIETYKLNIVIEKMKQKTDELNEKQSKLNEMYEKAEEKNNNLVYNLLGFLTAFSIVSAVVGVITQIKGIVNIMLFMAFTILLLLTTLIGLHNFYKNDSKKQSKLKDNYFLWKITAIIVLVLIVILGIKFAVNNKENIFDYLDNKIEKVIEEKITENLQNNT